MRHSRRHLLAVCALAAATLALPVGAAWAQIPASTTRIRGTLLGVADGSLSVKTLAGATVAIAVATGTPVTAVVAASLADIKPGSYVGTAAMPGKDGTLVALEVHIFPEQLRGTGEGHRPFTMGPQSTMTNGTVGGTVATVGKVSGRTITVQYAGGAKTVLVPENVPVVRFEPGSKALLRPGAHVSVTANEPAGGGALTAVRIAVGRNGLMPPV